MVVLGGGGRNTALVTGKSGLQSKASYVRKHCRSLREGKGKAGYCTHTHTHTNTNTNTNMRQEALQVGARGGGKRWSLSTIHTCVPFIVRQEASLQEGKGEGWLLSRIEISMCFQEASRDWDLHVRNRPAGERRERTWLKSSRDSKTPALIPNMKRPEATSKVMRLLHSRD